MAKPWFWFAMGAMAVGATLWQAQQQAEAMEDQAAIAEVQREIALEQAQWNAEQQIKAGRDRSMFIRRQSRRNVSTSTVRVAGSGAELSGSPLATIGDQIRTDEHAAATVMANAYRGALSEEARGRAAAAGYGAQADALREGAVVTRQAGFLDAVVRGMSAYGGYMQATGGGYGTPGGYGSTGPGVDEWGEGASIYEGFDGT